MSAKNKDEQGKWRKKVVAFRVSPEEDERIEAAVRISGLTKQEYITRKLLDMSVVVQGNPRVYRGLRIEMGRIADELKRIECAGEIEPDLLTELKLIRSVMEGMKKGVKGGCR